MKEGSYHINVIPNQDVSPVETYSLKFVSSDQTLILANDVMLADNPILGYGVRVVGNETQQFVPIGIDIKPGSDPNSINLGSNGNVPVAILGSVHFDVTQVDPISVVMEGVTAKLKGKGTVQASFEDVNGDGFIDLVVYINTEALQLSADATEASVEAKLFDGTLIMGADSVRIVP